MLKLAVLASTRATDMDGIVDAINNDLLDAEISCVISNKKCPALEKAQRLNIPAVFIDPVGKSKEDFDKEVDAALVKYNVDLILLIGYMRWLTPWFVQKYENKVMNIHPSLLPDFAGGMDVNVHEKVLQAGVEKTGATLHFVDETEDGGPIIMQREVPIEEGETVDSLKHKVQHVEQEMLVKAVDLYGKGKISVTEGKVSIEE